ncbi:MAG: cytochrome c family protein [Gammaproteobacteria bacterium]|nr:cytochrome c family protein [Gammaproteobacteria bacterium]MCP5137436.1 cytochrome c family protein [Gammaproteobacteria bacterium]
MISKLLTPALGALLAVAIGMAHAESPTSMPEKMMDAMKDMVAHGMKPVMEMPAHMQATTDKDFKYLPSYMTVTGDRTVTEADFEDPAMCAGCHPKQYQGWQGSMHANSFVDPIFQKLWSMAEKATDGKLMNHCGACHTPIGILSGTVVHDKENDKFTTGPLASKGVSCDVCHTIKKTNFLDTATLEHGNASFEIDPQGPGGTKRGPLKDAVSPYHKTEYSDLHTKADFCGNCHNIFHAENGFPIERTYDEWKYSPYARAGIVCQDCHMNPVETAVRVAKEMKRPEDLEGENLGGFAGLGAAKQRDVVHEHGFVGGNAVVTALLGGGDDAHAAAARQRLQNAAEVGVNFEKRADGLVDLRVEVTNTSAGHNLPTSLTDVREIWVQVTITDDKRNVIFQNGQLDDHGELDHDNVTIFNAIARNGRGDVTHLPWEVTRFSRNTTIPPKGNAVSRYTFKAPDGATQVTADVKLNYRSYGQHLADVVLGAGTVTIPVIEMEHETASLTL